MARFNVVITHDSKMRAFKKQWFGIDETTDVISFATGTQNMPVSLGASPPRQAGGETGQGGQIEEDLVGEIVVNEDEVRRNAKAFGVSFEQEMARVVAHGVLHVYGYEDDTKEGKAAMKAIEDVVVSNGKWKLEVG